MPNEKTINEYGQALDRPSGVPRQSIHDEEDLDASWLSVHHTLGPGDTQAAPGDHGITHMSAVTITGSRSSGAALVSVIEALVTIFGATDESTT